MTFTKGSSKREDSLSCISKKTKQDSQIKRNVLAPSILLACSCFGYSNALAQQTSLNVETLLASASVNHPRVGSAIAQAEAQKERASSAKYERLPQVNFESNYGSSKVAAISLKQPIWTGGEISNRILQAQQEFEASEKFIEEERFIVANNVVEQWGQLVRATNKYYTYGVSLDQLGRFEQKMNRRVQSQISASIELGLIANRIAQTHSKRLETRQQQNIALLKIEELIGDSVDRSILRQPFNLKEMLTKASIDSASITFDTIKAASKFNPIIEKKQKQLEIDNTKLDIDKSKQYPKLYAQYTHQYDLDSREGDNSYFVGFKFDPTSSFSAISAVKTAQAQIRSSEQMLELEKRRIAQELFTTFQKYVSSYKKISTTKLTVEGAKKILQSDERLFTTGKKSWRDVLNSLRQLNDSRLSFVDAQVDQLIAYHKLKLALALVPKQSIDSEFDNQKVSNKSLEKTKEAPVVTKQAVKAQAPEQNKVPQANIQTTITKEISEQVSEMPVDTNNTVSFDEQTTNNNSVTNERFVKVSTNEDFTDNNYTTSIEQIDELDTAALAAEIEKEVQKNLKDTEQDYSNTSDVATTVVTKLNKNISESTESLARQALIRTSRQLAEIVKQQEIEKAEQQAQELAKQKAEQEAQQAEKLAKQQALAQPKNKQANDAKKAQTVEEPTLEQKEQLSQMQLLKQKILQEIRDNRDIFKINPDTQKLINNYRNNK